MLKFQQLYIICKTIRVFRQCAGHLIINN